MRLAAPHRRSSRRRNSQSGASVPDNGCCRRRAELEAMQSQNRFFDDMARVAAGAAGALSGVRGEIEARFRDQLERVLAGMDLVSREEFEAVKQMAAKAREEQELLLRKVETLEGRLAALEQRPGNADRGSIS